MTGTPAAIASRQVRPAALSTSAYAAAIRSGMSSHQPRATPACRSRRRSSRLCPQRMTGRYRPERARTRAVSLTPPTPQAPAETRTSRSPARAPIRERTGAVPTPDRRTPDRRTPDHRTPDHRNSDRLPPARRNSGRTRGAWQNAGRPVAAWTARAVA
ncbi:hypothetical protein OG884_20460 [Streptosporangium sp. NBC_01755]|uniref:hypothetical protein n=1 Tax=Streptosporangium sp. NBC_01755 TaxID=2975949 RepID=UPI002DDC32EA|nr:hypothetical protein [Streptosporangium sp. NBC_01755]WSD04294.1 hypothetical protein OG884_20460 [Streptosporangium sp. NBC_01755]